MKAELSRYLRLVKAGEEVLVTERRVPVARLLPIEHGDLPGEHLRALEREGVLRVGTGRLPKNFWKRRRARDPKGRLRKAVINERESGW